MVSSEYPVIKLILLSKLDHEGTVSRQASWYTYIRWPCDGVLFSVGVYAFSPLAKMFWNCEWNTHTCCLNFNVPYTVYLVGIFKHFASNIFSDKNLRFTLNIFLIKLKKYIQNIVKIEIFLGKLYRKYIRQRKPF